MGEDATAIDIGDEHDGTIDRFRVTHVRDVAVTQVDLGGTAGAFHHHGVVRLDPTPVRNEHRVHRDALVSVVTHGIHVAHGMAVHDHLRTGIAVRFQQHGIEVGM